MQNTYVHELVDFIAESIAEKKGNEITIVDVKGLAEYTDYFVLATADSDVQLRAIANWVENELKDRGINVYKKEGFQDLEWILLDYVDVVVHLFKPEARDRYHLEKMWADAKIQEYVDGKMVDVKALSSSTISSVTKSISDRETDEA